MGSLELYCPNVLRVKDKGGKIVPFHWNFSQRYLHNRLEDQKMETGKIRHLVGKCRQSGISTYIGARFYHRTTLWSGTRCFILTHEQAATDNLFEMVERFHKHAPMRPSTEVANAKELYFDKLDSGYAVGTAGTKALGRSKTIQLFHGSEVAYWANAAGHFAGVIQGVPDLDGTEIVLESTGNGSYGEFKERWAMAEANIGDYRCTFIPWFWTEEYQRPVPPDFRMDDEEQDYQAMHSLSLERMVWRRAKIAELKNPILFKQEYPATATEMFTFSGNESFISAESVIWARKMKHEAYGPKIMGADPARFGDDRFSVALRQGRVCHWVQSKNKLGTVEGANWLKSLIDEHAPTKVFIDLGGQGAGVFDILVSWGEPYCNVVVGVNFGSPPQEEIEITESGETIPGPLNRRSEMWKRSKEWLEQAGGADLPDLDSLQSDAVAPGYSYDIKQRLKLESKETMRGRGIRSPDEWDAFALTFAEPVRTPRPKPVIQERFYPGGGQTSWLGS